MIGCITHLAPSVFEKTDRNGNRFQCSEAFVRKFLENDMGYSVRRITKAGQKVPTDADTQLYHAFLRASAAIRDEDISPDLMVNSDQTNIVYAHGSKVTFAPTGDKQVSGEGYEEKRAFTLQVSVSASGKVLPFQAIYQGVDARRSLPSKAAPFRTFATSELGIKFVVSGTSTYWSNLETMKSYVTDILAPYFRAEIERLGLPPDQRCLWLIDVWSVQRSAAFREWVKKTFPWIIINYIPGGCTGLFQPCDVGIQRPLKHAIRQAVHRHKVDETLTKLRDGTEPSKIVLDKTIGVARDRSVEWLVKGYEAINKPELVQKVSMLNIPCSRC